MSDVTRFDDIQARLKRSTPGPWREQGYDKTEQGWIVLGGGPPLPAPEHTLVYTPGFSLRGAEDAEFIAHCPDDVEWLLDRVTQLETVAAEAQRYLALDPHVSGKRLAEALAELDRE